MKEITEEDNSGHRSHDVRRWHDCFGFLLCLPRSHQSLGSACPVLIVFLTDGGAPSPRSAVESLLADHSKNIKGLTCVAFGQHAAQGRLQEIGQQFIDQSIDFKLKGADSEACLVETFVAEAAASRAIHT